MLEVGVTVISEVLTLSEFYSREYDKRVKKYRRVVNEFFRVVKRLWCNDKSKVLLFVTLTVRNRVEWSRMKKSYGLRNFIKNVKREIERQGYSCYGYVWVLEMQKRFIPHYHLCFIVDRGVFIRSPDLCLWTYGSSNVKRLEISKVPVKYLSKYLAKSRLPYVVNNELENYQNELYNPDGFTERETEIKERAVKLLKGMNVCRYSVSKRLMDLFKTVKIEGFNYFRRFLMSRFNVWVNKRGGVYTFLLGSHTVLVHIKWRYVFKRDYVFSENLGCLVRVDNTEFSYKTFDPESVYSLLCYFSPC